MCLCGGENGVNTPWAFGHLGQKPLHLSQLLSSFGGKICPVRMSIKCSVIQEASHNFKYYTNRSLYYFTFPFPQRVCWAMEPEPRLAVAALVAFLMTCSSLRDSFLSCKPEGWTSWPSFIFRQLPTTISAFRLQVFIKMLSLPWAESWVASLPLQSLLSYWRESSQRDFPSVFTPWQVQDGRRRGFYFQFCFLPKASEPKPTKTSKQKEISNHKVFVSSYGKDLEKWPSVLHHLVSFLNSRSLSPAEHCAVVLAFGQPKNFRDLLQPL